MGKWFHLWACFFYNCEVPQNVCIIESGCSVKEGNQRLLPPYIPFWHKNYFELEAIYKHESQEKRSLPSPNFCLNTGYTFSLIGNNSRLLAHRWHQRNLQINHTPLIAFTDCHPWKPKTALIYPIISLETYYLLMWSHHFWVTLVFSHMTCAYMLINYLSPVICLFCYRAPAENPKWVEVKKFSLL